MQVQDIPKAQARQLVANCFRDLVAQTDAGIQLDPSEPDEDRVEQRGLSQDEVSRLRRQRVTGGYDGPVVSAANLALASIGLSPESISPGSKSDLYEGIARAFLERERLFQFRLDDRLAPFQPTDPLFAEAAEPLRAGLGTSTAPHSPVPTGPTVSDAIAAYLAARKIDWTAKTFAGRIRRLSYFEQHLGGSTVLSTITSHHIREYKKAVCSLRANHGRAGKQTFAQKQTDNVEVQIKAKTATLIFEPCKAFFNWATNVEGYLDTNPAANVRMAAPKKPKGEKRSRRPFTAAELTTLFSAPLFKGHYSPGRRFEPGTYLVKDGKYWLPILGYYTGARLGELVQLHVTDVELGGHIPLISVNENNSSAPGTENYKHVKSEAGVREIPLHTDLLALGFAEFVARRKKQGWNSNRLFADIAFGSDGQASTTFSKWFGRLMEKAGLSSSEIVFHSFRHCAEDAFRNAGQQQYVIDRIIGHTDGATSAGYGEGVDLETKNTAVRAMKLKLRLPDLWSVADTTSVSMVAGSD